MNDGIDPIEHNRAQAVIPAAPKRHSAPSFEQCAEAGSVGLVARLDEAHVGERAEPHVAGAVIQSKAVDPGSRAAWPDLQIQPGAVMKQTGLGERADLCFGELLDKASHEIPLVGRTHVPQRA